MRAGGRVSSDSDSVETVRTETPLAALSFYFVFGLGSLGQPHVIHKYYMLRDPLQLRWMPLLSAIAIIVSLLLFIGVGVAMKALVLDGQLAALTNADETVSRYEAVRYYASVEQGWFTKEDDTLGGIDVGRRYAVLGQTLAKTGA